MSASCCTACRSIYIARQGRQVALHQMQIHRCFRPKQPFTTGMDGGMISGQTHYTHHIQRQGTTRTQHNAMTRRRRHTHTLGASEATVHSPHPSPRRLLDRRRTAPAAPCGPRLFRPPYAARPAPTEGRRSHWGTPTTGSGSHITKKPHALARSPRAHQVEQQMLRMSSPRGKGYGSSMYLSHGPHQVHHVRHIVTRKQLRRQRLGRVVPQ